MAQGNPPDLKLTAKLNDEASAQVDALILNLQKGHERASKAEVDAAAKSNRLQYETSKAQAGQLESRWEKLRGIEEANYTWRLTKIKGNDELVELEAKRHTARLGEIASQQKNFPNTPFQKLLGNLGVDSSASVFSGIASHAFIATAVVVGLGEAISSTIHASLDMQTIDQTLKFASGSAEEGARNFAYLTSEATRLGFGLKDGAQEFAKFEAAAKGTSSEGKVARDVFSGMSEAFVSLHLSTEQQTRALYALQEMESMGTVQTRQLRMISMAIPGGFKLFADALGLTTEELMKMMKQGKLATDEVLPKLAEQLHKTYGDAAVSASDNARQSIQKFKNEVFLTSAEIGGPLLDGLGKVAGAAAKLMEMGRESRAEFRGDAIKSPNDWTGSAGNPDDWKGSSGSYGKPDTDKQIEHELELQDQIQAARFDAMKDGEGKELVIEKERYDKVKAVAAQSQKEIGLEEQLHQEKIIAIKSKYSEENAKVTVINYSKDKTLSAKMRAEEKTDDDKEEAQRRKHAEVMRKINEITVTSQAESIGNPYKKKFAELEAAKSKELNSSALANPQKGASDEEKRQAAIAAVKEKYRLLENELDAKQNVIRAAAAQAINNAIYQGLVATFGKNRELAQIEKQVDAGLAIMRTAAGVTLQIAQGNVLEAVVVGVTGAAEVAKIESQSFATGGYTGPGGRNEPAGIVHRGEMVWNQADVARVGGPAAANSIRQGGGGHTFHISMPIQVHGNADASTVSGFKTAANESLRSLAQQIRLITERGITA